MNWMITSPAVRHNVRTSSGLSVIKASVLALSVTLGSTLGAANTVLANDGESAPAPASSRFTCEIQDGEYTVMYRPQSEPGQAYPWAVPTEMGGGWTPELRCETISARLEEYRPDGLVELRTDVENGYNTVCATTEEELESCRIVFTVPVGQDPVATRDAVFSNITLADAGTDTNAVNTFMGSTRLPETDFLGAGTLDNEILGTVGSILGSRSTQRPANGIYLKPYLDPADGGTGAYLNQAGQRLNPENFR
ncbi:MAG: COP23 domain-containing protein [Cyanobacteria bacterium P01_H01_bin.105]